MRKISKILICLSKSNKIILRNRYVMKLLEFDLILLLKNKMFRSKLSKKPQNDKQSTKRKFLNRLPQ